MHSHKEMKERDAHWAIVTVRNISPQSGLTANQISVSVLYFSVCYFAFTNLFMMLQSFNMILHVNISHNFICLVADLK